MAWEKGRYYTRSRKVNGHVIRADVFQATAIEVTDTDAMFEVIDRAESGDENTLPALQQILDRVPRIREVLGADPPSAENLGKVPFFAGIDGIPVPPPRVEQTAITATNPEISKTVGQGVGQLVADLGVEGLAQVLVDSLSPVEIERLSELLAEASDKRHRHSM